MLFFNDTATTEIYTLSLHDALPISPARLVASSDTLRRNNSCGLGPRKCRTSVRSSAATPISPCTARKSRSEEHTSELQSRQYLVCRLLLEKKKISNLARLTACSGPH